MQNMHLYAIIFKTVGTYFMNVRKSAPSRNELLCVLYQKIIENL